MVLIFCFEFIKFGNFFFKVRIILVVFVVFWIFKILEVDRWKCWGVDFVMIVLNIVIFFLGLCVCFVKVNMSFGDRDLFYFWVFFCFMEFDFGWLEIDCVSVKRKFFLLLWWIVLVICVSFFFWRFSCWIIVFDL